VASDYVYRDGSLLAAETPQGTRHFSLDHLDTPRLVTAAGTGGDFYTLTPCRVLDTRDQSAPLLAGETRNVLLAGTCGIPSTATAVSVNITFVGPTAQGELTAYPANEPRPTASAISYRAGLVRANNGLLKMGSGALAFFANQPSGSVHLILDVNGYFQEGSDTVVAYHVYFPFGEEATAFNQDTIREKFTGHERDLGNPGGAGDDLDYMHARHESPVTGRFLSMDPVGKSFDPAVPQSWNRYSYVRNTPLNATDPSGEILIFTGTEAQFRELERIANSGLFGVRLVIDRSGRARLVPAGEQGPPTQEQAALAGILGFAINDQRTVRIGLVSGDPRVMAGSFDLQQIDVRDLAAAGRGPALTASSLLAHEIFEQAGKQFLGLPNIAQDRLPFEVAHAGANVAQSTVSGFSRGITQANLVNNSGTTVTQHTRAGQTVTVTIFWVNGNIVRIMR
jgi:RHS repeat-associated protein